MKRPLFRMTDTSQATIRCSGGLCGRSGVGIRFLAFGRKINNDYGSSIRMGSFICKAGGA